MAVQGSSVHPCSNFSQNEQGHINEIYKTDIRDNFYNLDIKNFPLSILPLDMQLTTYKRQLKKIEASEVVFAVFFKVLYQERQDIFKEMKYCLINEEFMASNDMSSFCSKHQIEERCIKKVKNACHVALGEGRYFNFHFTNDRSGHITQLEICNPDQSKSCIAVNDQQIKLLQAFPIDENTYVSMRNSAFSLCYFRPEPNFVTFRNLMWFPKKGV